MNARITKVNDHITSEVLAPTTTISWNPPEGIQSAVITFTCAKYHRYDVDGTYFGAPQPDGAISISASQLLGRKIPVMLPGGKIVGEQPAELFDAMLRGLFDMLVNETRYVVPGGPQEPPAANGAVTT